jgi:hypothetical protein
VLSQPTVAYFDPQEHQVCGNLTHWRSSSPIKLSGPRSLP